MTVALAHETFSTGAQPTAAPIRVETAEKAPLWVVGLLAFSTVLTLLWSLVLLWGGYSLLAMIGEQILG